MSLESLGWDAIAGRLAAVLAAIAGWFGIRQLRRLDVIEKEKVAREELNAALAARDKQIDRIVSAIDESTKKADARGERIHTRIDQLTERVSQVHAYQQHGGGQHAGGD